MSMIFYFLRVSPEVIAQLRADPSLTEGVAGLASQAVWDKFADDATAHLPEDERQRSREERAQQRTAGIAGMSPEFAAMMAAHEAEKQRAAGLATAPALCLQKSWDALEHALTRDGAERAGSLFADEQIGGDVGYGPAMLRAPDSVRAFAAFLDGDGARAVDSVCIAGLRSQRVYGFPDETDTLENDADLAAELQRMFAELRAYVREAADSGDGLLAWMS